MTRALLGGADCARGGVAVVLRGFGNASATEAVSYTHLTLPTKA